MYLMTTTQNITAKRRAVQALQNQAKTESPAARKEINRTIARIENEMHALIQTL